MERSWPPNLAKVRSRRFNLMLKCRQDDQAARVVYQKCKEDPIFFLENFGWVEDPQTVGSAKAVPVVLYDYQKEYIRYLASVLLEAAASEIYTANEILEKARKTAGTWTVLFVFIWLFLFYNASFFILSKKEDAVDKAGDMDTPFEKIRFFIERLPDFLLPQGFSLKKKAWNKTMLIKSPLGGQISGDSATATSGRQNRALAALLDEFAFCENDASIWAALSGTVKVRIAVSTPNGPNNKYYRLRFNKEKEEVHVTSFTWWKHPVFGRGLIRLADGSYTSPWYEQKCRTDSMQTIAKDYDLNYMDSIAARIFTMYGTHHIDSNIRPTPESRIIRIWDPGLCFAVLWAEVDEAERWIFHRELVMNNAILRQVALQVLEMTAFHFENMYVEDIGDPANVYRRGPIVEDTEYGILQKEHGIYVNTTTISRVGPQKRTENSIQALCNKMGTKNEECQTPNLIVNPEGCPTLHEAFMGAYCWEVDHQGAVIEGRVAKVHPYGDVADCARYLALHADSARFGSSSRSHLRVVKGKQSWKGPGFQRKMGTGDTGFVRMNIGG